MRNMRENAEWTEARDLLLELVCPVGTEKLPPEETGGRVLARDLLAMDAVPPFDRSAYDGYAFRAEDTASASKGAPVTLRVTETVPAGKMPTRPVLTGEAARVMTGAPIPEGADCVINYESTVFTETEVTLFAPGKAGANIVRRGEDVKEGTLLAPAGIVTDAALAGTAASQGFTRIEVFRRVRVGLISTGREIAEAGEPLRPGQIRNANRASFTALLGSLDCDVSYFGIAGDDTEEISRRIREGLDACDMVILTGGVSVGEWDRTPAAMESAGARLVLRGVRMKPGMACAYGFTGDRPVLGLSGNPVSAVTNFCACVLPALRKMQGRRDCLPEYFSTALEQGFPKKSPSTRFLHGKILYRDGEVRFLPSGYQGNVMLHGLAGCDAYAVIPSGSGPLESGTVLQCWITG